MAQITEVKVNYGFSVQVRDREWRKMDLELTGKILEGESSEEATEDLRQMAKLKINQWVQHELKKKASYEDYL